MVGLIGQMRLLAFLLMLQLHRLHCQPPLHLGPEQQAVSISNEANNNVKSPQVLCV